MALRQFVVRERRGISPLDPPNILIFTAKFTQWENKQQALMKCKTNAATCSCNFSMYLLCASNGLNQRDNSCLWISLTVALNPEESSHLEDRNLLGWQTSSTWQVQNEDSVWNPLSTKCETGWPGLRSKFLQVNLKLKGSVFFWGTAVESSSHADRQSFAFPVLFPLEDDLKAL